MGSWRVFLAAFLAVVPVLVVSTTPAHACVCIARPLEEMVAEADLIVVGTVEEFRAIDPLPSSPQSGPSLEFSRVDVVIAVDEYVKGSGSGTEVATQRATGGGYGPDGELEAIIGTSCDTFSRLGDRYVLLLRRGQDGLQRAGACGGTATIRSGDEARAVDYVERIRLILEEPPPTEQPPPTVDFPDTGTAGVSANAQPSAMVAAGGFGALLAAGALLFARRPGWPGER